jgi:hypothetical protein
MKRTHEGRPAIKITTGKGGSAGVPLAERDIAGGLTPGSGMTGTAGRGGGSGPANTTDFVPGRTHIGERAARIRKTGSGVSAAFGQMA